MASHTYALQPQLPDIWVAGLMVRFPFSKREGGERDIDDVAWSSVRASGGASSDVGIQGQKAA